MDINAEVTEIKGVGPRTAEALAKAGLKTIRDLLYYFPRAYENYQQTVSIADLAPGKVMIRGRIQNLKVLYTRRKNFTITQGEVYDDTGAVRVVWYNQPYRARAFKEDQEYYFSGDYDFKYNRYQLTSPTVLASFDVDDFGSAFQPIYPARGSYNSVWFKKLFEHLRLGFLDIPDLLPLEDGPDFLEEHARSEALYNIHFPESQTDVESARQYLAYEELFELILAAKLNQQENQKLRATALPFVAEQTKKIVTGLPFQLTKAQRVAAWDILRDLAKPTPMNRLLQGDVGSGKTVVAALAAAQCAAAGHQAALLAPTAILATQHHATLSRLLSPLGLKVALLTAAVKDKPTLKQQIKSGAVDLVVGTHALLTDDTEFQHLTLAIIDEQHRFGVHQRQKLLGKTGQAHLGLAPHFLAMTATPIPRSLQLTIFGDLDVSVLNQLPPGRQPIQTSILPETSLSDLYKTIKDRVAAGQQVYWICPAIDNGADDATKDPKDPKARPKTTSVAKETKRLQKALPTLRIAALHGRQKAEEKDAIMADFAAGKIDLLVSTTVIEVGVDVPNATQIVIMDAEHFGLAQLHQLRGRVGRGDQASHCYLVVTGENPPSRRLKELEKSTDGFHLAEVDLQLRGPGEIYGTLQHGALDLRIATLTDTRLIAAAQKQAQAFAKHPENMLQYPELARSIRKYQQLTTLN